MQITLTDWRSILGREYHLSSRETLPDVDSTIDIFVKIEQADIRLDEQPIAKIRATNGQRIVLRLTSGAELSFDTLHPLLGCNAQTELLKGLGARVANNGELLVDAHQSTSIPGLYAGGDVVNAPESDERWNRACGDRCDHYP